MLKEWPSKNSLRSERNLVMWLECGHGMVIHGHTVRTYLSNFRSNFPGTVITLAGKTKKAEQWMFITPIFCYGY